MDTPDEQLPASSDTPQHQPADGLPPVFSQPARPGGPLTPIEPTSLTGAFDAVLRPFRADPVEQAAYARSLFGSLRARLGANVVGHAHALDRLADLGTRHLLGTSPVPLRAVLVGPSGSAKTTILRLLQGLGTPWILLGCDELAETNWYGVNIADAVVELWQQADGDEDRMARGVICLDELDKVAIGHGTGTTRDYQTGRQRSLLPLLGGGPIHFSPDGGRERTRVWDSRRALVVCAGVFEGLPPGRPPVPADLRRLGIMHELIERMGAIITLEPLGPSALATVIRMGLADAVAAYALYGYRLTVTPEACGLVAGAVAEGRYRAGPRQAVTLLAAAAQTKLLRLLADDAPVDTPAVLTPDDVALPARARPAR